MSRQDVPIRWQDIDGLGHVSHVAILSYLEEGRDAWLQRHGIGRDQYVVGRCSVAYLSEIRLSDQALTVECDLCRVGTSSLVTTERILASPDRVMVQAEFHLVVWDARTRRSRPITEQERERLVRAEEVLA